MLPAADAASGWPPPPPQPRDVAPLPHKLEPTDTLAATEERSPDCSVGQLVGVSASRVEAEDRPRELYLRHAVCRLTRQARRLRSDIRRLRHELQAEEERVLSLLEEARRVREELLDVRFLEDLLLLLDGHLERMPLREWPFALANPALIGEANLVI